MKHHDLTGRTALIYGGSGLIGAAIARRLYESGANIAIHYYRGRDSAVALAAALDPAGERAFVIGCDITSPDAVETTTSAVVTRFGSLDIVVNTVHAPFTPKPVAESTVSDWRLHLDALTGHFNICKAALAPMRSAGYGRIVYISAALAVRYAPGCAMYSTVKDGLNAFSRTLALEEGKNNITVNIIAPGRVDDCDSESGDDWDEMTETFLALCPLGRFATSRDVSSAVLYLVSEMGDGITGQTLFVTGGEIMR